jgi:hypothetical protein
LVAFDGTTVPVRVSGSPASVDTGTFVMSVTARNGTTTVSVNADDVTPFMVKVRLPKIPAAAVASAASVSVPALADMVTWP